MPSPNKQPIFVGTPILVAKTFDPVINTNSTDIDSLNPTEIYVATADEGTLIERITVTATVDIDHEEVTPKIIYICVYDSRSTPAWSIYTTEYMTYNATKNPTIVINIDGGLVLQNTQKLGFLASTNKATTGFFGDYVAVVVEGGTYAAV